MTEQKSILVTGCSSGIGRTVAKGLKARGYRVFATARKETDIEELTAEGFETHYLDYSESDSIHSLANRVLKQTGNHLYALFNNGAYGQPGAVEDLSRDVLRLQFEANLFGWHELTCALLPSMRAAGQGRIIHNSSVLGFSALTFRGAYTASKYALEGLSDTLRMELRGSGIDVSLIEPGPILSRFRANSLKMFLEHIDYENSVFRDTYKNMLGRLEKKGAALPFTLGPEAVLSRVIHALEAKRPKPRYYVTFPTYAFGVLKRVLSTRAMDEVLIRASGAGRR